ncbi:MAG: uncharacterized protein QOE33_1784 [Acidobacteriota bacterium]|nr:uncharacterized protein [Acidobacteriota bacterium]
MSEDRSTIAHGDFGGQVIDIDQNGEPKRRKRWRWLLALALVVLLYVLSRASSVYIDALWFGSLGYTPVYWTTLKYEVALFVVFALATTIILRLAFRLMERAFDVSALAPRRLLINQQPVLVNPARILKPAAWLVSLFFGFIYGAGMSGDWQRFALWLHQPATSEVDPVFGKRLGFYLFTLPVAESIASWFTMLAFIITCGAVVYALLSLLPAGVEMMSESGARVKALSASARKAAYATVSTAFALLLAALAVHAYLSRFAYLFDDHTIFSGVTYTEDHYVLPGLFIVTLALIIAAALALANAFALRRARVLVACAALPIVVYLFAVVVIPGYVQSFIVKPNELDRESPYITRNISATRRAFNLEQVEARDFPADTANDAYALEANRPTLDNLRLWDYRALQDTLRQVQEIRTYYDFNDVDIDRYQIGGQTRQVLLAARELDVSKLPASTRGNWINERLIYTHGYGVTMNTANGFTAEGRPEFLLSNMPTEATAPDIKLTRPQIYFGEKTDTTVYVKTKQNEFDYPQGDANASTVYEGNGGFEVGGFLRRWVLAWETDDLSRLPFADDVTPQSRVLMRRTITDRVHALAPFLTYDTDPYIVVNREGHLFWLMDAYTTTDTYPYARHHDLEGASVNYLRNSVKVSIDAYDGSVTFYVFDKNDPILSAYRNVFPALFRDAAEMPEDLRAHVRYPETMLSAQADVYSLYHTDDAKIFFQREDMWSVARASVQKEKGETEAVPLEPYYALLQLPAGGTDQSKAGTEFVNVLAFTPASRDNLIGWMAGRSDGDAYGHLLVYKFPKSKLVNGPLQVNARIDQNAQLSSQLTLWNQEGSRVQRGNLLIIPLGRGLLYVQTIYLQAVRSPMPELRLVVLATQDRLAYGTTFAEALANLFGNAAPSAKPPATNDNSMNAQQQQQQQQPAPSQNVNELIKRAASDLADYQRLTAEGKLGDAGQKLESLKHTLDELQKVKQ